MKAYITAPYTGKSVIKHGQVYGEIKDQAYKNFLETIEAIVRNLGFSTFLPHRDIHKWGVVYIDPKEVYEKVMEAMKSADIVIAYPEASTGAKVDIGLAAMLKKKIIIILNKNDEVSLTYEGLKSVTDITIVKFSDIFDLKIKLQSSLNGLMKQSRLTAL